MFKTLRASLVLLHVVAIFIAALPTTRGAANIEALSTPAAQAELKEWSARLGVSKQALIRFAIAASTPVDGIHRTLLEPVMPYLGWTGALQPWRLFIAPNRMPTRYTIETHVRSAPDASWQTVFQERSNEHTWNKKLFDHERTRCYFEVSSWSPHWWLGPTVCRWAAKELFRERPELDRVRCRHYRQPSPTPEQAKRGETNPGEWIDIDEIQR